MSHVGLDPSEAEPGGGSAGDSLDALDGFVFPQAEVELTLEDFSKMFEDLSHGLAKCKICCKIVTDMERHHKMHALKKYHCPLCSLSLTRADNLKRHMRLKHKLSPDQIELKISESGEEF